MIIKEQTPIDQHLDEASDKDCGKYSIQELKDLLTIFESKSRKEYALIGAINKELNSRIDEETRIEEAKVVPFKKLEQAWTRTGGDKGKQAKLIKKHDLKKIISTVRPGEIKLGVKNKLLGTTKAATAAGLDLDDQLIFVTNNPLKIIYPKKSSRRPEGEEIKESVDIAAARLEKMVSLVLKENDLETIKFFIENSDIDLSTAPSKIREGYKSFDLSESAAQRKLKTSNKLSSKEYEKFSKLKAFNDKDWKWNSKEGLYNRVNEEVELDERKKSKFDLEKEYKDLTGKKMPAGTSLTAMQIKINKAKRAMKEETELDEAKNITVRALRQMMFKLDSSAADKFRKELFKIDAQDSPASNAQIKKGKKIAGNKFGKKDFTEDAIARAKEKADLKKKHQAEIEREKEDIKDISNEDTEIAENKTGIQNKADKTGISYSILKKVFDRGVAAWKTGHRPGTTPSQWGFARINSFATGGKTRTTADKDLWAQHKGNKKEALEYGSPKATKAFKKATPGEIEEASKSDIKKVLASAKKAGGKIKGNKIDFGMGTSIEVSIDKGRIKLDGGRDGIEYFKNAKDAVMAFEETQQFIDSE